MFLKSTTEILFLVVRYKMFSESHCKIGQVAYSHSFLFSVCLLSIATLLNTYMDTGLSQLCEPVYTVWASCVSQSTTVWASCVNQSTQLGAAVWASLHSLSQLCAPVYIHFPIVRAQCKVRHKDHNTGDRNISPVLLVLSFIKQSLFLAQGINKDNIFHLWCPQHIEEST